MINGENTLDTDSAMKKKKEEAQCISSKEQTRTKGRFERHKLTHTQYSLFLSTGCVVLKR